MKPVFLRMQAFGPYAGEQCIDFTRLKEKNCFLISGPTGSGKTSILDAMVFALYGSPSGDMREGKSLRSDYAPVDYPTEVEFIFSLGQKEYKVLRHPEQELKKKRGEGTHKIPGSAALSQKNIQGQWEPLSSKSEEVTACIEELLGFKAGQFTQIVLLPQGEFRKFLIADSKDRQKILETLFHTDFYSRLEETLGTKSKALQKEYEAIKNEQTARLASCACQSQEELDDKISRTVVLFRHAEEQTAQLKQKLAAAQAAWEAAQSTIRLFTEKEEAEREFSDLIRQSAQYAALEENIRRAEEALPLNNLYSRALTAWNTLKQQKQLIETAAKKNRDSQQRLQELQKQLSQVLQSLAWLKDLAAVSSGNTVLSPQELTEHLEERIASLTQQAAALSAADNLLIRLARTLRDGQPCPVCGAPEHPQPADKEADHRFQLQKEISEKQAVAARLRTLQKKLQDIRQEAAVSAKELGVISALLPPYEKAFLTQKEDYQKALADSSFATKEDFLKAVKLISQLEELRHSVQEYQYKKAAASARLQRVQAAIRGLTPPNTTELENAVQKLTVERDSFLQETGLLKKELEILNDSRKFLIQLQIKLAEKDKEYQMAAYLAQYTKGDNPYKLTLSAYVLQTFLDDVLLQANDRLKIMTRNRYQLRRSTRILDARRKSGLDLEIDDAYTGQTRPVKTLSGGETFLASLALALGLTDVVQAYAGGIRLDTILIDEGFGTLDPEALETAINALIDLQANGRLVGIISHVTELQERIDARLEVIPGENGSKAVWHL